jgi:flavin-binding protein dodecin
MAIMKVIELLAQSPTSWEDACQMAVDEASKTVRNIQSVYVKNHMCEVDANGRITNFRVNVNLTFRVDSNQVVSGGSGRSSAAKSTAGGRSGGAASKSTASKSTSGSRGAAASKGTGGRSR